MNTFGTVHLDSSTIAANVAANAGGISNAFAFPAPKIFIRNTIVANNAGAPSPDVSGALDSTGYNLIRNTAGSVIDDTTGTSNYGIDPMLDTVLTNNGGLTPTVALLRGSPAIDKGLPGPQIASDQRGKARPFDFPGVGNSAGGDGSDIGAFELHEYATQIKGRLIAPPGELLRNAIVTLRNTRTGEVRCRYVNSLGNYDFRQVLTGDRYEIEVKSKSFAFPVLSVWVHGESDGLDLSGTRIP